MRSMPRRCWNDTLLITYQVAITPINPHDKIDAEVLLLGDVHELLALPLVVLDFHYHSIQQPWLRSTVITSQRVQDLFIVVHGCVSQGDLLEIGDAFPGYPDECADFDL
jgi:hypothetical protein